MAAPIVAGMPKISLADLKTGSIGSTSPQVTTKVVEIGLSNGESVSGESSGAVPLTQQEVQQTSVGSDLSTSLPLEQHIVAYDGKTPPSPQTISAICELIVGVLERYRLLSSDDVKQPWGAKEKFLIQVKKYVVRNDAVCMALPAFPFKSPNKKTKVLGTLPDKGEEVALSHLEGLCLAIQDVYAPGAAIYIVSDGLMYNDILGISDQEVWRYGQALRQLANDRKLTHIHFLRLRDLIGPDDINEPISEEDYLRDAPSFRSKIKEQYLPENFDPVAHIAKDVDTTCTYRGYIKFLETDLATRVTKSQTKAQIKGYNEGVAIKMIARGKAFANAIATRLPDYIRLSIHQSTETSKLSMSVIPQIGRLTTPWHGSLVRAVDGSITMSHAARVSDLTHDLIYEDGRPSYFRERSPLFDWPGMNLDFNYIYPTGIIITPQDKSVRYSFRDVDMKKIRGLSEACSPVVLRRFKDTTDVDTFESQGYAAGEVAPWTFGIRQAVKNSGSTDPKSSTVTSNEAMPMHYDGFFFLQKEINENGEEKTVSKVPRFQYFTAITPSAPGDGYTLFASSQLFFQHLPQRYSLDAMKKLVWDCKHSSSNFQNHMTDLPLVVPHPTNGKPCIRWHEPWYQWQTKFSHNQIRISNGPQFYKDLVNSLLYDRRVCLYFNFEKGDILVCDNISMMHTRTAFNGDSGRELWRIHFN